MWSEHKSLCGHAGSDEDETLHTMYKRVGQDVIDVMDQIAAEVRAAAVCAHGLVDEPERIEQDCLVLHLQAGNRKERRQGQCFQLVNAAAMPLDVARKTYPHWASTIAHFQRSLEEEEPVLRSLVLVAGTFTHQEAGDAHPHHYAVYRSLIQNIDQPALDTAKAMRFASRRRWQERLGEAVRTARLG